MLEAAGDTEGAKEVRQKMAEQNKQLKAYCEGNGLKYRSDRVKTYGSVKPDTDSARRKVMAAEMNKSQATVSPQAVSAASSFLPAKTVQEAQGYAGKFIEQRLGDKTFKGVADFKEISVEHANDINRALTDVFEQYDFPKISGIKSIDPNSAKGKKIFSSADAVMAYSPVEHGVYINKNVLKNPEALAAYNKQAQEAWNTVMENMDSLTGAQREIAMRYKQAGRSLVGDGSAHDYFVHEMGHHLQWEAFDAKTNNSIGSRMSQYAGKISGYATASKSEYFAESFAAFKKGEFDKLDPQFVLFMRSKALDKSAGSGIMIEKGLYRKTSNSGAFSHFPERISKKHIREVAKKYGFDTKGLILNIDTNEELLRIPFAGEAVPEEIGKITFFPNAFRSEEELLRTLFHESVHVQQFREFGIEYVQNNLEEFERRAYAAENEFIEKLKKEGRL